MDTFRTRVGLIAAVVASVTALAPAGAAQAAGRRPARSRVVGLATVAGGGYLRVTARGAVFPTGTRFHGSPRSRRVRLASRVVGIAAMPGGGYVVATAGGAVYPFGTRFLGSPRSEAVALASPVVGIAAMPNGGYLVATSGGAVYPFGARFRGSPRSRGVMLSTPVVGIAAMPHGGYVVATSGGAIYPFGARFRGSPRSRGVKLSAPVVGISATTRGGYVLATVTGQAYPFGSRFYGSPASDGLRLKFPVVAISTLRSGGYMIATSGGTVHTWAVPGAKRRVPGKLGSSGSVTAGPFYLDTMATQGSCQGIRLASQFYATGAGANADGTSCSGAPAQPHALIIYDGTLSGGSGQTSLTCSDVIDTGGCAKFISLPTGSGASASLQTALNPYVGNQQAYLVILTGPPGSVGGDPNLPNSGFSYVFQLTKGVSDLNNGWRNVGQSLGAGADGKPAPAGQLRGWLQPVVGSDAGISYSFVGADYPTFDTNSSNTTAIGAAASAPHDLAVDVLRSTASSGDTPGEAIDVPGASTISHTTLEGKQETDLPPQRWLLKASSVVAGYYHLVNINSGLCLDITGPWPPNGTGVLVQFECDATPNQQWHNQLWKPAVQPDGSYELVTDIDQKSVVTFNQDGTLGVAADTGGPGQRFALASMTGALAPQAVGVLSSALGPALELAGGPNTTAVAGTKIVSHDETDQATQQWLVVPTGNPTAYPGTVNLVSVKTAQCLSVPVGQNGQTDSGPQPDQENCPPNYDHPNQLWTAQRQPDGSYALINVQTKLALTLSSPGPQGLGDARRRHHKTKPRKRRHGKPGSRRLGDTASTQSMWFTSSKRDIKDGFPATGTYDFYCSDYAASGQTTLYPYLVPEGSSYEYRNANPQSDVRIAANIVASNAYTGKLSVNWTNWNIHGDWAIQVSQHCTGQNPNGWTVSSTGPQSATITSATLGAQLNGFPGNVAVHAEYGPSAGKYPNQSPVQNLTGNKGQQSVSVKVTGLQPNTTYHYRIVAAETSAGTPNAYSGSDQTFTTPDYNYGSPVKQATFTGAPGQKFTFRPLARTVTTRVGTTSYDAQMPLGWSGFSVLGLDRALTTNGPFVFYTNTPDSNTDGNNQANMGSALKYYADQSGAMVLVQSINRPHPSTGSWQSAASQIDRLGGTPQAFNALDGSGDYALAGCSGCGTEVAQQTSSIASATGGDSLSGVLHRDAQSDFQPMLSDAGAMPNPAADYGLAPLAYATPKPWPIPSGVTATANAAVLADMANALQLTAPSCYQYPANQPDVRSTYCDLTVNWQSKLDLLQGGPSKQWISPPGQTTVDCSSSQPITGKAYSGADWCAVAGELSTEFINLNQVATEIKQFQALFQGSESLAQSDIQSSANTIKGLMSTNPTADASGGLGGLAASWLGLGATIITEPVGTFLGAVSELIYIGGATSDLGNGSLDLSDFQDNVDDFTNQMTQRLDSSAGQFGTAFDLLAQDPSKLATAAGYAGNQWSLNDPQTQQFKQRLLNGVRAQLYTTLLPAYYTRFSVQVPAGKSVQRLECPIGSAGGQPAYDNTLKGEPNSAVLNPVSSIGSNGQQQRQFTWFLAAGTYPTSFFSNAMNIPSPGLTDPMFKSIANGGIGLDKTDFFITSGFRTHDQAPPSMCDFDG